MLLDVAPLARSRFCLATLALWGLAGPELQAESGPWTAVPGGRFANLSIEGRPRSPGFTLLGPSLTHISFTNVLSDREAALNQIRLNGSGVALADVNGDGRCDVYLCGLENPNALFLNLGDWGFTNVTDSAGVACAGQYSTGAVFADVDGDRDADLLVNGIGVGTRLFLNDGSGRFAEAMNHGLASRGGATSMALADVDGDGDLDLYVANYRTQTIRSTGFELLNIDGKRVVRREDRGALELTPEGKVLEHGEPDFFYLNDGQGHFSIVSWTGGRFREVLGEPLVEAPRDWGLTVMFRDLNGDGAPDLYVCNDFHSPDRIWFNDGQGNFRAAAPLTVRHTPTFSMSIDVADINRDGLDDWFVADMLSRRPGRRLMQLAASDPYLSEIGRFDDRPQFDRNALFLNRGDGTWTDIACLAGIEATEWTWSAVFLDVDLDGYEDLLCTTGHAFDTQDLDAEQRMSAKGPRAREQVPFKLLEFPPMRQQRQAFRNRGDLTFSDESARWGFNQIGVAHGMALADLDNDGDLDVVVNELNGAVGIYRNETLAPRIGVRLRGAGRNAGGIGARIRVRGAGVELAQEMMAGGRYLSGDDGQRSFAASDAGRFEIRVRWRSGLETVVSDVRGNRVYEIAESSAVAAQSSISTSPVLPLFEDATTKLRHSHTEKPFDDYALQPLLPRKLSQAGPSLAWVDPATSGLPTLVIGTGAGGRIQAFTPAAEGMFQRETQRLGSIAMAQDVGMALGCRMKPRGGTETAAQPMLVVSQNSYESPVPAAERVRVIGFEPQRSSLGIVLPEFQGCVGPLALADVDGDGDLDLFVGGRVVPGRWPASTSSFLLRAEGSRFIPDEAACRLLEGVGLVSSGLFTDVDGDGDPDLVLACEWGPLRVYENRAGTFTEVTEGLGLNDFVGWWNGVSAGDFDGDGRMDLVASNWGWNDGMTVRNGTPAVLEAAYGDFDENGQWEVIMGSRDASGGPTWPVRSRRDVARAWPAVQDRFPTFASYNESTLESVLGEWAPRAQRRVAGWFASAVFLNRGDRMVAHPLPKEAQFAPAFGVCVADFDNDGNEDVFLAQNFFPVEATAARQDGGVGLVLLGNGQGGFRSLGPKESGIRIYGEGRAAALADYDGDGAVDLAVSQNGTTTRLFRNRRLRPGLSVRLAGDGLNPEAVGASVRLVYREGKGPRRELRCGGGYASQDHSVQVLGLRAAPVALEVSWPDGKVEVRPMEKTGGPVTLQRGLGR